MPNEPFLTPSAGGPAGSAMASQPDEGLAANAVAHIERSGFTIEGFSRTPREIDEQAKCLLEWARGKNVVLGANYTAGLKKHDSSTAEHEVFYRLQDNRVVKVTHAGTFGVTPDNKGDQTAASPLFYLRRLGLMNRVFFSQIRMEGVMLKRSLLIGATGDLPSIVVSQPWLRAAQPQAPHPSPQEISAFMELLGFTPLPGSYFGWQRTGDSIIILDARPDNFIKTDFGVIPIDLVVSQRPAESAIILWH